MTLESKYFHSQAPSLLLCTLLAKSDEGDGHGNSNDIEVFMFRCASADGGTVVNNEIKLTEKDSGYEDFQSSFKFSET